ncbi:MAG: TIGR03936 family radical SAM-associated protein [Coriobacteriia bacterium]|nr:TIGR03936 family radical SAM-associated protein [Coriobacteriia bacterium]MCL2871201.1 TIGR03936 family radical SAM-associated protein [Coriobacteriia bacterium]
MTSPTLFRLRIAYAKQGRGRFLAHLEVQRALSRMVRRSGLPYAVSQGFNPQMRLSTGPALSVAVSGEREYCDLVLTSYVKPVDALCQLQEVEAGFLPVLDVGYVGTKEPSLNASIVAQELCVIIENAPALVTEQALKAGLTALQARDTLEVEHKGKTKVYDSATHVPKGITVVTKGSTVQMTLMLRISNQGSLRPDALLSHLLQAAGLPSLEDGKIGEGLVRTDRTALFCEALDEEGNEGTLRLPL